MKRLMVLFTKAMGENYVGTDRAWAYLYTLNAARKLARREERYRGVYCVPNGRWRQWSALTEQMALRAARAWLRKHGAEEVK